MTKSIGLRRGDVKLVAHDSRWAKDFDNERDMLKDALGDKIGRIEHVGSTSVPGLMSKPLIDMIAEIDMLKDYKQIIEPLQQIGYEYMPARVYDDRVLFPKGPRVQRTHHLSIVLKDSKNWHDAIIFRDYLRTNPKARKEYESIKLNLAQKYPNNRELYTKGKESVIQKILAEIY